VIAARRYRVVFDQGAIGDQWDTSPVMLRRLLLLLAALTALVLASVSSALEAAGAQTRVRAFDERWARIRQGRV
jgi:hypothetical protein